MPSYGQFCPVAMASEVLTERWTPLVIRELLCGSRRFNDLRRGVPLMSPSLLSKRLKTLERCGVVERDGTEYHLTPAGEELRPLIESMGVWGQRWSRGDVEAKHYDASLLMWDLRRNVDPDRVPTDRTVVHFHLKGSSDRKSHFWLVLDAGRSTSASPTPATRSTSGSKGTSARWWTTGWGSPTSATPSAAASSRSMARPVSPGRCRPGSGGARSLPSRSR